jgi:hypothetical protein
MHFDENFHPGRPHFHAVYAGAEGVYAVKDLESLAGSLPPRIERLVRLWAGTHRDELIANWDRARLHQPLQSIDPLQN